MAQIVQMSASKAPSSLGRMPRHSLHFESEACHPFLLQSFRSSKYRHLVLLKNADFGDSYYVLTGESVSFLSAAVPISVAFHEGRHDWRHKILLTSVSRAEEGAFSQLGDVSFWPLDDFRTWARGVLGIIRGLRRTLGDECDLAWRAEAQAVFEQNGFDAPNLYRQLAQVKATKALKR
jgi:hypothetical protein